MYKRQHIAKVVAANFAALGYLYFKYQWAVEQKALLDTDTAGYAPYSNAARVAPAAVATNNETLEDLYALFAAFANFLVDFDSVARAHVYHCALLEGCFKFFDVFHIRMILPHITSERKRKGCKKSHETRDMSQEWEVGGFRV